MAKTYIDRVAENGQQLPLNRNNAAKAMWEELSMDIGSQADFINDAELDKSSVVKVLMVVLFTLVITYLV